MKNHSIPPKYFKRFLTWFCHPEYAEELIGDIEESFCENVEQKGLTKAKWIYRKEVLLLLRPSVIKPVRVPDFSTDLLATHTKIAWRNMLRHRLFSGINILGLAASMSLGLIVIGMIHDLLKFDEFHDQKDRIFRVISNIQIGNYHDERAIAVMPIAEPLKSEISGVEEVVRIQKRFNAEVDANGKLLWMNGYFTDPAFLTMFTFPLIYGDPKSALNDPYSVVITKGIMNKVFDGENPVGQEMQVGDFGMFKITAVLEDIPKYSHLQFEMLGSISTLPGLEKEEKIRPTLDRWDEFSSSYIYTLLAPGRQPEDVVSALNQFGKKGYEQFDDISATFDLQPLPEIVPGMDLSDQIGPKMMVLPIVILSLIALAVLLSACFNYTNLSIARALRRSKEVGVRKVVGATRRQVAGQFLVEAIVITLFALVLGIGIFETIKNGFMQTIPRADTMLSLQLTPLLIALFILFALFAGLMAGGLPAAVLSKMHPVNLVKQYFPRKMNKKLSLNKVLIVFQFVISLFFIGAGTIAYQQFRYAMHHDMGFDQNNILNVTLQGANAEIVKSEFGKFSEVVDISFSSIIPGTGTTNFDWVKQEEFEDSIGAYYLSVDPDYLANHDLNLLFGRNFDSMPIGASSQIIINEQLSKVFDWQQDEAIGQVVDIGGVPHQIIGVVKDFNYNHIEEPINSFFFRYQPERFAYANLKINSQDVPATITALKETWKKIDARHEFEAVFLEAQIEDAYYFLVNNMKIFGFLSFIAVSIACLGLLGMAVYTIEVKLKEISVRKVFGASSWQVVSMLSTGFVKILLVASVIALPLTFLLFDKVVLRQFAFRINIGGVELGSGVLLLLIIGLLTISSQTWKAARMNPAEVLKGE